MIKITKYSQAMPIIKYHMFMKKQDKYRMDIIMRDKL